MPRQIMMRILAPLALAGCVMASAASASAEPVRIGGTGMALAAMRGLAEGFASANPGAWIDVLPSLGTPGGLRALLARHIEVALAARPLVGAEREAGLSEAVCAGTALIFATNYAGPFAVTKADLPSLYANPQPVWPGGTPLKVILRSRAGTENEFLTRAVPDLVTPMAAAYERSGMPVGVTDQENTELATRMTGSFAVMTLMQLKAERLALNALPYDGVAPTVETIADRRYPLQVRLCLVVHASARPDVLKFTAYVKAPDGQALLRQYGAVPVD